MKTIVEQFGEGLAEGKLLIQSCESCGTKMLYPRHRCISCGSNELGWCEASGKGTLHSYTVVRAVPPSGFEEDLPYGLGVIKLDEGVQLLARLHPGEGDDSWGDYICDAQVEFQPVSAEQIAKRPVAWFGLSSSKDRP